MFLRLAPNVSSTLQPYRMLHAYRLASAEATMRCHRHGSIFAARAHNFVTAVWFFLSENILWPALQGVDVILDAAVTEDVAFLVVGDPFAATTHTDLQLRARCDRAPFPPVAAITLSHHLSLVNEAPLFQSTAPSSARIPGCSAAVTQAPALASDAVRSSGEAPLCTAAGRKAPRSK